LQHIQTDSGHLQIQVSGILRWVGGLVNRITLHICASLLLCSEQHCFVLTFVVTFCFFALTLLRNFCSENPQILLAGFKISYQLVQEIRLAIYWICPAKWSCAYLWTNMRYIVVCCEFEIVLKSLTDTKCACIMYKFQHGLQCIMQV